MKSTKITRNVFGYVRQKSLLTFLFISFLTSIGAQGQSWSQTAKMVMDYRASADQLGWSVTVSGDYAIAGVPYDDEDASESNYLVNAGSAGIFKKTADGWVLVQKLAASDRHAYDNFGYAVAISGDYAVVGAWEQDFNLVDADSLAKAGAAYIFKNTAGTWSQVQKIVPSDREADDYFGWSIAMDGDYILVGAYREDEDAAGSNTISEAGSAYLFKNNSGTWSEVQKLVSSDRANTDFFGRSVAISGDYAIVGADQEDEDASGGNTAGTAGSAYIFKNTAGTWSQVQKIVNSDRAGGDLFGWSVSISGDYAIIGAYREDQDTSGANTLANAGSAYIFKNNSGTWNEQIKLVPSDRLNNDWFGYTVGISGNYAIIGAYKEDEDTSGSNTLGEAGSAYVFKLNGSTWSQAQKIVPDVRAAYDHFARSVAISGGHSICGAYSHSLDSNGGNSLGSAGGAYMFSPECLATNSLPTTAGTTYTGNYRSLDTATGWTHVCSEEHELLLSLKIGSSGAKIYANEVQLQLGSSAIYGYGAGGGMISNTDGYEMIDRRWDVSPTTQPSSGNVGVMYYFTNNEYSQLVDSLLTHKDTSGTLAKSTVSAVTELNMFKATSGSAFDDPHTVTGNVLAHGATPSESVWKHSTHGSVDHMAEFEVSSFSGGGGGGGGGGGSGVASLPVELISFNVSRLEDHGALIQWSTASELNNSHFVLLRSYDGLIFQEITQVMGNGTTNDISNYAYFDETIHSKENQVFYELQQIDFNGLMVSHGIRKVTFEGRKPTFNIYPNPTSSLITIQLEHMSGEMPQSFQVINSQGVVLKTMVLENGMATLNLTDWKSGLYFLVSEEGEVTKIWKK